MSAQTKRHWMPVAQTPPSLTKKQWYLSSLVGIVFLAAGILQLINFQNFSDNLAVLGFGSSSFWGGLIVFVELWAAAGFFKIRLSFAFRAVSNFLAVATAGFWFYEALRQISEGSSATANFFGKYLVEHPGWETVIEATVFLALVLYLLETFIAVGSRPPIVTKVTRRSGKKAVQDV